MGITEKIKASVESATGLTLHYYDDGNINAILDANPLPCAFYYLLKDTEIIRDTTQIRERANVAIFFVNKTDFDFDSEENEAIISDLKKKANIWLTQVLKDASIRITSDVQATRLYNEFDVILTGIGYRLTIEEIYGFNACKDVEFEPTRVLNINDNGLFDIHNYYWVNVDVPTIDIYEKDDFLHIDGLNIINDYILIEERE